MSGITRAMTSDACVRRVRAVRFGVNLSFPSRLAHRTRPSPRRRPMPLKTRDTVAGDTPASFATS